MGRSLLARLRLLLLLGFLPYLISASGLAAPGAADEKSEKQVEQWIKDLGSDCFELREAATRSLVNLEDEPPSLRKALKSPDPEMRQRVAHILESHHQIRARRGLKRVCILAKEGRVDEMIERLVFWKEWISNAAEWGAVCELVARVAEWEQHNFGNARFMTPGVIPYISVEPRQKDRLSKKEKIILKELTDFWTRSPHYLGREIVVDIREDSKWTRGIILATESVRTPTLNGSVLVAGGSIQMRSGPMLSIILCDGDLEASYGFFHCLIIVRGKVTCHKDSKIAGCTILSGGPASFTEGVTVENTTILSGGPITCAEGVRVGKKSMLRATMPEWPVKFFDLEAAGLTVWQVYRNNGALGPPLVAFSDASPLYDLRVRPDLGAGVQIKEIRKGTTFAGLREGDIITAIDEQQTPTKELFRKVLRRKLAEGGPLMTLTVRRADKTLAVPIPVKD